MKRFTVFRGVAAVLSPAVSHTYDPGFGLGANRQPWWTREPSTAAGAGKGKLHFSSRHGIKRRFNSSSLDKMAAILADDNLKCIFLNENDRIPIRISLKCIPMSPIDNKSALVQVMAWRRTGAKPLSGPMLTQFADAYMRHKGRWVNAKGKISPLTTLGIFLILWYYNGIVEAKSFESHS